MFKSYYQLNVVVSVDVELYIFNEYFISNNFVQMYSY